MSAGKATFVSGIVVGVTTGFILGHFTLWKRASTIHSSAQAETEAFVPFDLNPLWPTEEFLDPHRASQRFGEVYYAPVSDSREQAQLAVQPINITPEGVGPIPPTFLPPPDATPIGSGVAVDLREMLTREAPELSEQEAEVWLDVLNGLSEDDAVGIIRMWQLNGGDWPPSAGIGLGLDGEHFDLHPLTAEVDSQGIASNDARETAGSHDVFRQLGDVTRYNISNSQTPGFRGLVPILSNAVFTSSSGDPTQNDSIRIDRISIDVSEGALIETRDQWDVAIRSQPRIFFRLRHDDQIALTRYGHFCLDDQRRLCVEANGHDWLLVPEVFLPEGAVTFQIDGGGIVSMWEESEGDFTEVGRIDPCQVNAPGSLLPIGDRLYAVDDEFGLSAHTTDSFELMQGYIEGSNVDLRVERARLAWLEEILQWRK